MEFYISFSIINLIVDFVIIEMINYYCKLYNKFYEIILLMVFSLVPTFVYIFYKIEYYQFILLKILDYFIFTLLMADKHSFSRIIFLFSFFIFSLFSIYGFIEFFIQFVKIVFNSLFKINLGIFYDFIIVFALFLYIVALIIFFGNMFNKGNIQSFLYKVSFSLFDNHIEINGLLDSGNSLYDTKTGKAVVIVSLSSIKKFISKEMLEKLFSEKYDELHTFNKVSCVTVGGNKITIPIIDIGEVKIEQASQGKSKTCKCVLGITKEKFAENNDYECLLHREFL